MIKDIHLTTKDICKLYPDIPIVITYPFWFVVIGIGIVCRKKK